MVHAWSAAHLVADVQMSPYDDGWLMGMEISCVVPCLHGKHWAMTKTYEEVRLVCAEAAHEMNRVYCMALGDFSQASWGTAEDWQRTSAIKGVDGVFAGNGPGASHESWLAEKVATGWTFGPVKDAEKKEHPCMVPFTELPFDQQQKDHIFVQTVHTMAAALGHPVPGIAPAVVMNDGLQVTCRYILLLAACAARRSGDCSYC